MAPPATKRLAPGFAGGTNAALQVQDKESWCPGRDTAYTGVLVDDLISMGTQEPYRMFTSRAEYRLLLREDNADLRLTEKGRELGLVDDERWRQFSEKREAIELEQQRLKDTWVQPDSAVAQKLSSHIEKKLAREYSLFDLLKRPELDYKIIGDLYPEHGVDQKVAEQVEIDAKYSGYINRQQEEVDRLQRHENTPIPSDFDYQSVSGLSNEIKQKLSEATPETLARASRIPGVTPAAISLLIVQLKNMSPNNSVDASLQTLLEDGLDKLAIHCSDHQLKQLLDYLNLLPPGTVPTTLRRFAIPKKWLPCICSTAWPYCR